MIVDVNAWIVYATSAAGFFVSCLVGMSVITAYNKWLERRAVERIEEYLRRRFGEAA